MKIFLINVMTSIICTIILSIVGVEQKEINSMQDSIYKTNEIMKMMIQKDYPAIY